MISYQLTNTDKELEEILDLQQRNLPKNISDKEKKEQGFVTVEHSFDTLKKLHEIHKHTIAKYKNKVVGYTLSMDVSCKNDVDVLKPMFHQIDQVYKDNYIVMGQVCIDKNFRGKGVFKNLYSFMKESVSAKYNAIITEIDAENLRSIKAHQKIGFTELKRYLSKNQEWIIVILEC